MNKKSFIGRCKSCGRKSEHDIPGSDESVDLNRRAMLRGTLAAGCGLLIPAALLGCESGKEPKAGAAANDGAAPVGEAAPLGLPEPAQGAEPAVSEKASLATARYQAQAKGEKNCANCLHFIAESNTCQRVEGDVSPEGWCTLWTKSGMNGGYRQGRKPMTRLA